jgi:hypothetical protein
MKKILDTLGQDEAGVFLLLIWAMGFSCFITFIIIKLLGWI